MKRVLFNLLTVILVIIIVIATIVGFYSLFAVIDEKSQILKLEKYTLLSTEKISKQFEYESKKYVISSYYDDTSSLGHLNILLKIKDDYYRLEEIKKCDGFDDNIYIRDNKIYIHCIGKNGDILEYKISNMSIEKNIRQLNYGNTPNISQIHILIDKVDDEYIYLYSHVKIDDSLSDGNKVRCSLKNNICYYY